MKLRKVLTLLALLSVLMAACAPVPAAAPAAAGDTASAPASAETASLQILGPWRASEADAFEKVLDGFRESTGIEVVYEGVDDVLGPLTTRVASGSAPDLAILPVANGLIDLQKQAALQPLDAFKDEITANFSQGWIDRFTIDGKIYAIPTRADVSNLLWYNPKALNAAAPQTWAEFTALCDTITTAGSSCTAGIGKDTWTLSILFEDTYLSANGIEKYNDLMNGKIPFDDPTVVAAIQEIATFYSDKYTAGGSAGALGTGLVDGIARVFGTNADASFVAAGSWVAGIVKGAINKDVVEGETIDYIPFPGEAGKGSIIAAADVAVMLKDSPAAQKLLSYLISADGQARFAPNGYTVANKNVDPKIYSGLAAKTAELLATSGIGPSTGAALSNEFRTQLIEIISGAVLDPSSIEEQLKALQASR